MSEWSSDRRHRLVKRVASEYMRQKTGSMLRTAGEVRFVKDYGPDEEARDITDDYKFNPKAKKPLAKVLWSISCALGHLVSAYGTFTKIKSSNISPDGKLGGKGYVQDISDMREGFNECISALSAIQDTINDEISAPHWDPDEVGTDERDEADIEEMMSDSEDIAEDPEGFVDEEYEEKVKKDVDESLGK